MTPGEISLREYVESLFRSHEQEHVALRREQALVQMALDKAESTMNTRLEAMNEFRSQLNSQAATFATREILEREIRLVLNLIAPVQRFQDKQLGFGLAIVALSGLIAALVSLLLRN